MLTSPGTSELRKVVTIEGHKEIQQWRKPRRRATTKERRTVLRHRTTADHSKRDSRTALNRDLNQKASSLDSVATDHRPSYTRQLTCSSFTKSIDPLISIFDRRHRPSRPAPCRAPTSVFDGIPPLRPFRRPRCDFRAAPVPRLGHSSLVHLSAHAATVKMLRFRASTCFGTKQTKAADNIR